MGLPQESVLSPTLFSLFIADIYEGVSAKQVKLADDGTIWLSGEDVKKITAELDINLNRIRHWVYKGRMKINVNKTEYFIFSRLFDVFGDTDIRLGGEILKHNPKPKLLGAK